MELPNARLNLIKEEMDTNKGECLEVLEESMWIVSHSQRSSLMFCDLSPNFSAPTPVFQFFVTLQGAVLLNLYLPILRWLDWSLELGKVIQVIVESNMTVWAP